MRLKVGLVVIIGLLLAASNVMATSIVLSEVTGDKANNGQIRLIFDKQAYGIKIGNLFEVNAKKSGSEDFNPGDYVVKLKSPSGNLLDPISFTFSKLDKELKLYYGVGVNDFVFLKSKAGPDRVAVPTPEPGTFFLLAGAMAVGFGVLRKRVQK